MKFLELSILLTVICTVPAFAEDKTPALCDAIGAAFLEIDRVTDNDAILNTLATPPVIVTDSFSASNRGRKKPRRPKGVSRGDWKRYVVPDSEYRPSTCDILRAESNKYEFLEIGSGDPRGSTANHTRENPVSSKTIYGSAWNPQTGEVVLFISASRSFVGSVIAVYLYDPNQAENHTRLLQLTKAYSS